MPSKRVSLEKKVEQARNLAAKYMREGWGSRASVLHAIYDLFETDIPQEMFYKLCCILDPFHAPASAIYENGKDSGITTCGALSGALAAFSMVHGTRELPFKFWAEGMKPDGWVTRMVDNPSISPEEKAYAFMKGCEEMRYGAYYQIVTRFKEHFGTTDCFDLMKPYGDPITRECFRNCDKIVIWTTGMVAQVILEYERNPNSLKVGDGNVYLAVVRSAHTVKCKRQK